MFWTSWKIISPPRPSRTLYLRRVGNHTVAAITLGAIERLVGLQQLAAAWRAEQVLPLIAVTGSNGKTTVTQMIAAILRAWLGEAAHATAGNLNNHIGVPLTLLALRPGHCGAVVELGMNHPGEIAGLEAPGGRDVDDAIYFRGIGARPRP